MSVEQKEDSIDAFGEPLEHADEVVAAVHALLLSAQDAGGVDDSYSWKQEKIKLV